MQDKKKKTKKAGKVDDLKPAKDPKGAGMPQGSPQDLKSLLKHLQLGQVPAGSGKIAAGISCLFNSASRSAFHPHAQQNVIPP